MIRRRDFILGAGAAAGALAATPLWAAADRARALYDRAVVIDALGGPGGYDPDAKPGEPLSARFVADAKASGLTAVHCTVSAVGNIPTSFEDTIAQVAELEREIARNPGVFMQIRAVADLRAAKTSGRVGLIYGMQDSMPLSADFADRLAVFDNLGVRIVQPTYNRRNLFGDGCLEPANGGLSRLGHDLIAALNERRILVDLSHAGQRVHADGIAASKRPPAITHSGCRNLVDNPRNVWDAEMKALADKGGVLGIYFMPFLRPSGQFHAEDVIRHIEHAVKLMGEDHVGLGTDGTISGVELTPAFRKQHAEFVEQRRKAGISAPGEDPEVFLFAPEYNDPRRFETLAADLLKRGHSTTRVEKILGGNFARLFGEVWG